MKSINDIRTRWGALTRYVYAAVLLFGIVLGFIAGALIKGSNSNGDPIAVISWFIVFPAYLIADGILNNNFLWCSLRTASLPLAEGFVITQVSGWPDPFAVSITVAVVYFVGSLVVVGITRAVRNSRKG